MHPDAPTVTVVIPCFNMGSYLAEAVDSVLAQTYRDHEIIVVDDGSDDPHTKAVLDEVEQRVAAVLKSENQGVAAARNRGIRAARGSYILPLDADDLLEPDFLAKGVPLLDRDPELSVVCCDALLLGASSGTRRLHEFSPVRILSQNTLFVTSLFRKADWQRAGGYCTWFRYGWEDWDFWITLSRRRFKVVRIPEALFSYRIRPVSRDRSITWPQKLWTLMLMIARHCPSYLRYPWALLDLVRNSAAARKGRTS
uniref:Glycosyl transferase family 2 n=1 Tax=Geobacter sp. (strain M21) TaxID=443144 RepID=C6E5U1_GEOSM